jgi:hypothetical protein
MNGCFLGFDIRATDASGAAVDGTQVFFAERKVAFITWEQEKFTAARLSMRNKGREIRRTLSISVALAMRALAHKACKIFQME